MLVYQMKVITDSELVENSSACRGCNCVTYYLAVPVTVSPQEMVIRLDPISLTPLPIPLRLLKLGRVLLTGMPVTVKPFFFKKGTNTA